MKKFLLLGAVVLCIFSFNRPVFSQVDLYLDNINVYVNDIW